MGHGRNGEAVFDGYAVVQREGLEKRGVFGIHFVLSKINNIDRIGTNRELSRTRSSENTVLISLKPFLGFQTTLFIANILNFKYGISSNSVIPAPACARTGYGGNDGTR